MTYIDDHIQEKRYDSIEEYLKVCRKNTIAPDFFSIEPFNYLWKKGLLISPMSLIRIIKDDSDELYGLTGLGKLEGINLAGYKKTEGIHEPVDILAGNIWHLINFKIQK